MVEAFKKNITYFSEIGFKPVFNIMVNVASKSIKNCLEKEGIKLKPVEPHNHQSNTSEIVIQTFKNHFISGLCIRDTKLPTFL